MLLLLLMPSPRRAVLMRLPRMRRAAVSSLPVLWWA